jgi:hypothetical protein
MNPNDFNNKHDKDEVSSSPPSDNSSKDTSEENESKNIQDSLRKLQKAMQAMAFKDQLKEFRKSIESLVIQDPLKEFRKSMESLVIQDSLKEVRKSIESLVVQDPLKEFRKSIESLVIQDPLKEFRKSMESLIIQDPLKGFRKSMESLIVQDPLKGFRNTILKYKQITDAYKNVFTKSIPANTLEEAYQEVLSNFMAAQSSGKYDTTGAAIRVVEEIKYATKTFPPSRLSLEFYLNLLISLVFFLYSMTLSEQSELRISELINETQTNIIQRLNDIKEPDIQGTYYVVERAVNLRAKPTTKNSGVLAILYPNQTVRLVKRKGKWIMVEYYNHILGIHESGWCYKKYLKIIK